jgi:hypothetical protein
MNAGRIRSLAIVGVLLIAAAVLTKVAISDDKQSHTSYANSCPAGLVPIVTDPLPDYDQINLTVFNGSQVPGAAQNLADELSHRGFKVAKVDSKKNVSKTTPDIADLYYGPNTVAAAWVVRAEFLLSDPTSNQGMYFDIHNKSDSVKVVIGRAFKELGAKTEVNQAIAALKTPTPPPGTCVNNP